MTLTVQYIHACLSRCLLCPPPPPPPHAMSSTWTLKFSIPLQIFWVTAPTELQISF